MPASEILNPGIYEIQFEHKKIITKKIKAWPEPKELENLDKKKKYLSQ